MQAVNLDAVDAFLNQIEQQTLEQLWAEDGTPENAFFQGALTQMWIFAAYELMRTRRERANRIVKLADNGGLRIKMEAEKGKRTRVPNPGREAEIGRLTAAIADPGLVQQAKADRKRTHILFAQLEYIESR
jgi:hypothetical protein